MLKMNDYSFRYMNHETNSIQNIHIHIKKGECILLCGKSGCGKTTILRAMNGLIPHFYDGYREGNVWIDGQPIERKKMYELSESIGTVFQNPRSQFFNVDTDSEIVFGMENMGYSNAYMEGRLKEITATLHLDDLRERNIFHLSGGEKQKVAFASVYALSPDLFMLDEPSSNLDQAAIGELKSRVAGLKKQGKTIIISEHRIYYLKELIDRVIVLNNGKVQESYTRKEFLQLSEAERQKLGLRTLSLEQIQIQSKDGDSLNHEKYELVIQNLSVVRKKNRVLDAIHFTAKSGEVVAITGKNGAGKTTFARAICGLQKMSSGEIIFQQQRLSSKKRTELSYMVMQDVNYQLFAETVEKECMFGIRNPNQKIAHQVLEQMGLLPFVHQHPNTLSGGQKQRLAVAASLTSDKEILVFDEPTSGLDFDSMQKVAEIFKNLAKLNKIIFVITHDIEFIAACCNRILHLEKGRKMSDYILDGASLRDIIEGEGLS